MAMDMDIEMDLDLNLDVESEAMLQSEQQSSQAGVQPNADSTIESFHAEGDPDQLLRNKVHIRGLDRLTSTDIEAFMGAYFTSDPAPNIEWIDDTSANLIYSTHVVAETAMAAFAADEFRNVKDLPPLQLVKGKPFPDHPDIRLEIRLAVASDRKQRGARERSRFYLMNPEYDRGERDRSTAARHRPERASRERSDRRAHRYARDDPERNGRVKDITFDASLYDDNDEMMTITGTERVNGREQAYPDVSANDVPQRLRRELFPQRTNASASLRDRSASPARNDGSQARGIADENALSRRVRHDRGNAENRVRAQMIKVRLQESSLAKRELFPHKAGTNHHRSGAFDAADETADLFAKKMHASMFDGGNDPFPKGGELIPKSTGDRLEDRITQGCQYRSFGHKGLLEQQSKSELSIKGAARNAMPKRELIPPAPNAGKELFSQNVGKELFTEKLVGRNRQRRKAEDMFF